MDLYFDVVVRKGKEEGVLVNPGGKKQAKLRKSRTSRTSNGPWRSVSSKKSKKKKTTFISKLKSRFVRKTRKN